MKINIFILSLILLIQSTKQSGGSGDNNIEYLILFIIISLTIGLLCLWFKKLTTIPYTPMLIVFGMILGIFHENLWEIGRSTNFVLGLSGHTLLLVFIPPLIFESAFNTDFFTFTKGLYQIMTLAFPGVALTCFLIACIMKYILQYDYLDWGEALTMGAILAATDPVAVVALLKELGTPMKFNILLEGESLLNDGTATVFFFVFFNMVEVGSFKVNNFLEKFFRLTFGGPAVGLLIGVLAYPLLKRLMTTHYIFVVCTIFLCYATFYICESQFFKVHVSGILALVCQGVYLSYKLKGRIIGSLEEQMHSIWHFLAYVIETILFVLTGAYLGRLFIDDNTRNLLNKNDIWKVIIFQILLLLCRGIVLSLSWPILNIVGSKLSWKDILVMTYAGLRGAIGLSLALYLQSQSIVGQDYDIFKTVTIFYVCFTILFTVLIQGMTIKYVMQSIDFVQKGILNQKLKIIVKERLLFSTISKVNKLKQLSQFDKVNWIEVEEILKIHEGTRKITRQALTLQSQQTEKSLQFLDNLIHSLDVLIENKKQKIMEEKLNGQDEENPQNISKKLSINVSQSKFQITQQDNTNVMDSYQKEVRDQILDLRQTNLHKQYENPNLIKSKISLRKSKLQDSEDQFQHFKKRRGFSNANKDQEHFDKFMVNLNRVKSQKDMKIQIRFRIYKMIVQATLEKYEHKLCIFQTFKKIKFLADAQSENLKKLAKPISFYKYWNKYSQVSWVESLLWKLSRLPLIGTIFQKKLNQNFYEKFDLQSTIIEVLQDIIEESDHTIVMNILKQKQSIINELKNEVKYFKEALSKSFDNFQVTAIQTRRVLNVLINHQYELIQKFYLRGELTEKEKISHIHDLILIEKEIETQKLKYKRQTQHLKFEGQKKIRFVFADLGELSSQEIEELESKIVEQEFEKGDYLYKLNEEKPQEVFLLVKGFIRINVQHYSDIHKLGFGEIVGLENVYSDQTTNFATAIAENPSLVYKISIEYFKELCEQHDNLKQICQKEQTFYKIKTSRTQDVVSKQHFYTQMKQLKPEALRNLIRNSSPVLLDEELTYDTRDVVYVYTGKVEVKFQKKDETLVIETDDVISIGNKQIKALEKSQLLILDISPYINQIILKIIFLIQQKNVDKLFYYFLCLFQSDYQQEFNELKRFQRVLLDSNFQSQELYKQQQYRY